MWRYLQDKTYKIAVEYIKDYDPELWNCNII